MDIILNLLMLIIGFVFLIKGADMFVLSSGSIARQARISPLIIGLTLVAFGTSLPELAVSFAASITAAQQGTTADIALGNVVGSNIANITLILGASALMMPVMVDRSLNKREFPFLIGMTVLTMVFALFFQNDYMISRFEALLLLVAFAFYMYLMFKNPEAHPLESEEIPVISQKKAIILLVIGIAGVSLGGYMVTAGAEFIALNLLQSAFGMSATSAKTLVGLSVVSLGTSLPELVTSVTAAKKGENQIALGNIIGSNVFNTLFIVGLSGVVTPLGVNGDVLFDLGLSIGIIGLVLLIAMHKQLITRFKGAFLLVIYVSYILFIIIRALSVL